MLSMDIREVVRSRRSIRKYRAQPIPDELLDSIVDLARHAPSSMNGQPWTFTIIRDHLTKAGLAEIKNRFCPVEKQEYRADFLTGADAIVIIAVDRQSSHDRDVENGVLAAATLMLAAQAEGVGSVYMSAYRQDEPAVSAAVRDLVGMPADVMPISIVPLGLPDEAPAPKALKPLRDIIFRERYGQP